jgi:hypothetical protein
MAPGDRSDVVHAPNLTPADIGSPGVNEDGLPFIGYQGPQGYMIVLVPEYGKASKG